MEQWVIELVSWGGGVSISTLGLWKHRHTVATAAWGAAREISVLRQSIQVAYRWWRTGEKPTDEERQMLRENEAGPYVTQLLVLALMNIGFGAIFGILAQRLIREGVAHGSASAGIVLATTLWITLVYQLSRGDSLVSRITTSLHKEQQRDAMRR